MANEIIQRLEKRLQCLVMIPSEIKALNWAHLQSGNIENGHLKGRNMPNIMAKEGMEMRL